jgi:hypothetical protein
MVNLAVPEASTLALKESEHESLDSAKREFERLAREEDFDHGVVEQHSAVEGYRDVAQGRLGSRGVEWRP